MRLALQRLPPYPSRPEEPLSSSAAVDNLRNVLADAPTMNMYVEACERREKIEGMESHADWEGNTSCQWSANYTDRLFEALLAVIEAHGLDDDGWKSARWEVYDRVCSSISTCPTERLPRLSILQYAECFGGVSYYPASEDNGYVAKWEDIAHEWLRGKMSPSEWRRARHDMTGTGKRYNDMLPSVA